MKATIDYLFDTCREIITFDNSEFERPTCIADLKKCDNVIVDKKDRDMNAYPVMIDDSFIYVQVSRVNHFGGTIFCLEVV